MQKYTFAILLCTSVFLTSCLSTNKIQSIKCHSHSNGQNSLSESFQIEIQAEQKNGLIWTSGNMADMANGVIYTRGPLRTNSYYSLKKYNLEISGGERLLIPDPNTVVMGKRPLIESDIITIAKSHPPSINQVVQIVASLKKNPTLTDTLVYRVNYKGTIIRNYDALPGQAGSEVRVSVTNVHDTEYFKHFGCDVFQLKIETDEESELLIMSEKDSHLEMSIRGGAGSRGSDGDDGEKRRLALKRADIVDNDPGLLRKSGNAEDGSRGGDGRSGGKVILIVDPSAQAFASHLTIHNEGGIGGDGGEGGEGGQGTKRLLNEGHRPDGKDGNIGEQGSKGKKGSALEIIEAKVRPFSD